MSFLKKLSMASTGVVMLATATINSFATPVNALTVTTNTDSNALLNSLLGSYSGLSNFNVTVTGNSAAFGLFEGGTDPFNIEKGVVMSTGKVTDTIGPNNSNGKSTSLGTTPDDLAKLDISFDADATTEKLYFEYVFGSEEFPEYGGSTFNDFFELQLNGVNLAKLTNGQAVTINNLAPSDGSYSPDLLLNDAGNYNTQLDGFTKVLSFTGALNKGATNTLSIQIKDVGDISYDSAVFIKGNSLGTVAPASAVPFEFSPGLGILALGACGAVAQLKSKLQKRKLPAILK